jgi:hypothetical protein
VKGDPGGIASAGDLGNNNLDTFIVPGVYRQTNGGYTTLANNYPIAGGIGVLTVLSSQSDNSRFEQTWDPISTNAEGQGRVFFRRVNYAGTWYPWKAFNSTRVDQTAGRVIYQWDNANNREQIIYGDTGMRRIETDFKNGWTAAIGVIRRHGNNVTFGVYTVNPAARTLDIAYTIPSGFKPASYGGNIAFPIRYSGATNTDYVQITGAGDVYPPTGAISGNGYICVFNWITNDTWPTTLPGVASGSNPPNV